MPGVQTPDDIAWVRKVNARWIVREGFREAAAAYLDALERDDPERLWRSCARARSMLDRRDPLDDPKPWFYAGLFSLATPEEAARYLRDRDFTLACLPALDGFDLGSIDRAAVSARTRTTIDRIRAALGSLT